MVLWCPELTSLLYIQVLNGSVGPRTNILIVYVYLLCTVVYGLWEIKMTMMLQQQTKSLCNICNNFNVFSMPNNNSWSSELSYSTLLKWVVFSWQYITPDLSCLLLTVYNASLPWVYIIRQNITAGQTNIYL